MPVDPTTGLVDPDDIRRAIRPDTRLIAITHVSNVTGTVQPIREIGRIAREAGVPLVVDAAQSAGHLPIDVQADGIDLLAAPGHKALLGPLGTGFLYIRPGLEKIAADAPRRRHGLGQRAGGRSRDFLPDKYEPGSHNAIGIIGLSEGVKWVAEQTVERLPSTSWTWSATFLDGVSDVEGLTYYGPQGVRNRIGVFSRPHRGLRPARAVGGPGRQLRHPHAIRHPLRPLAHAAIGTAESGGTTRFSFGPFLSKQDVKYATDALAEIAMSREPVAR